MITIGLPKVTVNGKRVKVIDGELLLKKTQTFWCFDCKKLFTWPEAYSCPQCSKCGGTNISEDSEKYPL